MLTVDDAFILILNDRAQRALACVARPTGMRQAMIWCKGNREGYGFGKQVKSDYLAGGST
jgi:hypothetical protein